MSTELVKGSKFDTGKPRFSLLPKGVLTSILKVLEYGAKKYSVDNWQQVENSRTRYYDAAMQKYLDYLFYTNCKLRVDAGE